MTEKQSMPRCPSCDSDDCRVGEKMPVLHDIRGVAEDGSLLVASGYDFPWCSPSEPFMVCMDCGNEWPMGDTEFEFVD